MSVGLPEFGVRLLFSTTICAGLSLFGGCLSRPPQPDVYRHFVFATWNTPERTLSRPGFIVSHDGKQTYIATVNARAAPDPAAKVVISTQTNDERKDTPGVFVASVTKERKFLFTSRDKSLPAPLPVTSPPALPEGTELTIWGYEFNDKHGELAFARSSLRCKVERSLRSPDGQIQAYRVKYDVQPRIGLGLATNAEGEVVACLLAGMTNQDLRSHDLETASEGRLDLQPLAALAKLVEPQVQFVQTAVIGGDVKQLQYEWAVWLADPLQKVKGVRLAVKAIDERSPDFNPSGWTIDPNEPIKPLKDAETLDLVNRPYDAAAKPYFGQTRAGTATVWAANQRTPNPRNLKFHMFEVQVSVAGADGTWQLFPRKHVEFRPQTSTIPGLDGKPLEMPMPRVLPDGANRLTSDRTQVELLPGKRDTFPQPIAEVRPLANDGKGNSLLGFVVKTEHPSYDIRAGFRRPHVATAPQGKFAYLCSSDKTLHQIDLENRTTVATLKLDGEPTGIAISQAGIVVCLQKPAAVWVLNQDLKPMREMKLATPATQLLKRAALAVAASPRMNLGFVLTRSEADERQAGGNTLWMIDFETGTAHHALSERFGNSGGSKGWSVGSVAPLSDDYGWTFLRMHPEGKLLLIAAKRGSLCRIDGNELDFLKALPDAKSALLLTPDENTIGQRLIAKREGTISLFDAQNQLAEVGKWQSLPDNQVYGLLARDRLVSADAEGTIAVRDGAGMILTSIPRAIPDIQFITPLDSNRFLAHTKTDTIVCDLQAMDNE